MIASDVTQAQANLQSAAVRVAQADCGLRTGIATFNGGFEGLQRTTRMGDPACEITDVNPPGTVEPVEATRPHYLPPLAMGLHQQLAETRQVFASGLPCIFEPL
jgi:hypothetical protein